jgi:signal transduction histidine kinase
MAERLQRDDEQRRRLMADVAHELRTPLTVMQGRLEGLVDGVYPRDDGQLAQLLEETRVLARLIDDLRTLALAESGGLLLQREATDAGVLAREAARSVQAEAAARGVVVEVDAPADTPAADIDPVRIREVLTNLLFNALRHTPAGGRVTIGVAAGPGRAIAISVADTGCGIAPEAVGRIFDRFYKGAGSRGSGLGLAIARNLVAAHGGEITVRSEVGRGTTIAFVLPAAAA